MFSLLAKRAKIPVNAPKKAVYINQKKITATNFTSSASSITNPSNVQQHFQTTKSPLNNKPKAVSLLSLSESFLDGSSAIYVEQMYNAWKKDPSSVHVSWATYFQNVDSGLPAGNAFQAPPQAQQFFTGAFAVPQQQIQQAPAGAKDIPLNLSVSESMRLLLLIRAYQVRGHILANLDPLGLTERPIPGELKLETYGFTETDFDREIFIGQNILSGFLAGDRPSVKLGDLFNRLKETYCGTIGVEYMHIQEPEKVNWIKERLETPVKFSYTSEEKKILLDRLAWATQFESFLEIKFGKTTKRFGLEGGETLIPGLKALIDRASDLGVQDVVMGMAHRGRLNVLANVVRKPLEAIFQGFSGGAAGFPNAFYTGSGDVKYHLGTSYRRPTRSGRIVDLSLLANPSHLEAVNPVVEGKARARQYYLKDDERNKVMSILLHGDASFAGQGVVYETIDLSGLANYTTGGTIHIIINNQIGFTTDPNSSRGTIHCTDVAKAGGAPVFHVNGDDPEAVMHVCQLAADWRQKFHKDVVVDIVCYRKYGHNEGDEPRYTQPLMYRQIDRQQPVFDRYSEQLKKEGAVDGDHVTELSKRVREALTKAYLQAPEYKPVHDEWDDSPWKGFRAQQALDRIHDTGVDREILQKIGKTLCTVPENFELHPTLKKILNEKKRMFETGEKIDWGTAEALAFGSLLLEGYHVRLSGQDVERGTFSHRHAVMHDQHSNKLYTPLNNISSGQQENFIASNSSLSEFAVLGFELGYSLETPRSLVLWEAQFGDFGNGAQIIIDQFIASGEAKWHRQNGIVMLLPHGYDGQGPEHSSARLERFLQLSDSDPDMIPNVPDEELAIQLTNWQIVNCTTPANYFHALRRQVHRDFRKPLIVMSPKKLLRHPLCVSKLVEFTNEHPEDKFQSVIPETQTGLVEDSKMRKVVFCTGNIYYDLVEQRAARKVQDVAIVRVEQLNPFPFQKVRAQAARYPKAQVVWAQEEPKNMGCWMWIAPHIRTALMPDRKEAFWPTYIGRAAAASPATGAKKDHDAQSEKLLSELFA